MDADRQQYIERLKIAISHDRRGGNCFASDRFWGKVNQSQGLGPKGECWEWTGSVKNGGYGQIGLLAFNGSRSPVATHIVSWELENGPVPAGRVIRHTCDNPPCVNPDHLLVGTQKQNIHDMMERERHPFMRRPNDPESARLPKRRIRLTSNQGSIIREFRKVRRVRWTTMVRALGIDDARYLRIERGELSLSLEHYHFITRMVGLDEIALGILSEQWYEWRPRATKQKPVYTPLKS